MTEFPKNFLNSEKSESKKESFSFEEKADFFHQKALKENPERLLPHSEELKTVLEEMLEEHGAPSVVANEVFRRARLREDKGYKPGHVVEEARYDISDIMEKYKDNRDYLDVYNRAYVDSKQQDWLQQLFEKTTPTENDLNTIARINFDMNGLKPLNDLGGHSSGNKALFIFSEILKNGKTSTLLKEKYGIEIISSIEGGDEFGLIIRSPFDLKKEADDGKTFLDEVLEMYLQEIYQSDIGELIDFQKPEVRKLLQRKGIVLPSDFVFHLSSSAGASTAAEIFQELDFERMKKKPFSDFLKALSSEIFKKADLKATAQKEKFKKEILPEKNPYLAKLYTLNRES